MSDRKDEVEELRAQLARSRAETRAAFENRALVYAHLLRELGAEIGRERAADVMKRAIKDRGLEVGAKYRDAGTAGDLDEVARIFCEGSPCAGGLFEPGVEDVGSDRIVLRMTSCPLLDAWRAAGIDSATADELCAVSAAVDEGTFEEAGLQLTFLDRLGRPGAKACLLELVVPGKVT